MKRSATHRPRLTTDQVERARRLLLVHSLVTVAEMLGTAPSTIAAARRRGWKAARGPKRLVPTDWGIIAPGRTLPWLAAHYHASQTTVLRWRREHPVAVPAVGGMPWEPPEDFAAASRDQS